MANLSHDFCNEFSSMNLSIILVNCVCRVKSTFISPVQMMLSNSFPSITLLIADSVVSSSDVSNSEVFGSFGKYEFMISNLLHGACRGMEYGTPMIAKSIPYFLLMQKNLFDFLNIFSIM